MRHSMFAPFLVVALTAGCTTSTLVEPAPEPLRDISELGLLGDEASALIGPAGGEIVLGEATLIIPPGALSTETVIRIVIEETNIPNGFTAFSPMYRFEPAGLEFALPVRVEFPHVGDSELATVFWTGLGNERFSARETTVVGDRVAASSTHFSQAFVGVACEGEECCRRATSALDVLLMIDNSGSMREEQAKLAQQIPLLVEALVTGDVDGDGVQDFPAVDSLQVGTVSSDMGTGGFTITTCDQSLHGDDGILRTESEMSGCAPSYPGVQRNDSSVGAAAFANDVSCVAMLGTSGCGFEQPLDAMLRAVAPSSLTSSTGAPITFSDGAPGHGDGENAGLVRDGAVLALINLTDENDCSASDSDIFDRSSPTYTDPDLNLRCSRYPGALHPASRYSDGFLALKSDPSELVYATISGIPSDLEGSAYAAVLADPRMAETADPEMPSMLTASCSSGDGIAYPPRRLIELADQLDRAGASTVASSICDADFSDAIRRILQAVADSSSGACR